MSGWIRIGRLVGLFGVGVLGLGVSFLWVRELLLCYVEIRFMMDIRDLFNLCITSYVIMDNKNNGFLLINYNKSVFRLI
jgi:hypothetical protein